MNKKELEQRTKRFALRVIAFVSRLPRGRMADVLGYQLLKAGTSVGGNYREAVLSHAMISFTRLRLWKRNQQKVSIGLSCSTSQILGKSANADGF